METNRSQILGNLVVSESQGSLASSRVGGSSGRTGGKMLPGVSSVAAYGCANLCSLIQNDELMD